LEKAMPEESNPQNEQLDEELADYTDKLLQDGQGPDGDPAGLGRTVEQLWTMSKDSTPSQATKVRIHSAIVDEWQQTYPKEQAPSIWQRIESFFVPPETPWRTRSQVQRATLGRIAVAVVMMLVLALAVGNEFGTSSATAGQSDPAPWIVTGIIVISGFLWLWITREK
jgi:hypothetical protein